MAVVVVRYGHIDESICGHDTAAVGTFNFTSQRSRASCSRLARRLSSSVAVEYDLWHYTSRRTVEKMFERWA